jgi:hypothetical protein
LISFIRNIKSIYISNQIELGWFSRFALSLLSDYSFPTESDKLRCAKRLGECEGSKRANRRCIMGWAALLRAAVIIPTGVVEGQHRTAGEGVC